MIKTKLTSETVEQALACAAISYATKEGCRNDSRSEIWFCDLNIIMEVGKAHQDQCCQIGATIDHIRVSDKMMLTIQPYGHIDDWLIDIPETELTDEKAIEYMRKHLKKVIEAIVAKGIHWSRIDENWKIGGKNKNIHFIPTEPRGKGTHHPGDWRILHDPTEQDGQK